MAISMVERSMETQERATVTLARANVYNFLAAVYAAPPTGGMVAKLVDGVLSEALVSFDAARPHLEDLEQALIGIDAASLAEVLAVEHRRLFVGPGPSYVPPYQSVHSDKQTIAMCGMPESGIQPSSKTVERLLWGHSTVSTLQSYREAGLEPVGDLAGVPDHLALQLQFMQHLCGREAAAWNSGRREEAAVWLQRQHLFLAEHLAPWLMRFSLRVIDEATHPWYRVVAALTNEFVADDLADMEAAIVAASAEKTPCSA